MNLAMDQVLQAALALPVRERERLIDELVVSCAQEESVPLDEKWLSEIKRRSAELDAGLVKPIPWQEVKARLTQKE